MGKLTVAAVKALKHPSASGRPARFGDGDGLCLQIAAGGTKSWLYRYTVRGQAREMGLGSFGEPPNAIPLAKARILASVARSLLQAGIDPIAHRRSAMAERRQAEAESSDRTFEAAAAALIESKKAGWRNEKHAHQWLASLQAHVFPAIGGMPVQEVDTSAVLSVLRPIWGRIPETASRIRQRIESVLDAAQVKGWRSGENPARWKGHLAGELPPARKVKRAEHRPALPWQKMPEFMAALSRRQGTAVQALRFLILTAARSGEVRGARWREIDLNSNVWVVPGVRMKSGRTHRVPMSPAAIVVLEGVQPFARKLDDLIFPGGRLGVSLSDMTISAVLRRMNADAPEENEGGAPPKWSDAEGRAVVPHGFRSTFRDWAGETRPEGREVVERALAHAVRDKAEAAYARSDLLEKRRSLMDAWACCCCGMTVATVRRKLTNQ